MTPHFSREEFICSHCGKMLFTQAGVERLEELRVAVGFPLKVNSGYRCPEHPNELVKENGPGVHTYVEEGLICADLAVFGEQAYRLQQAAAAFGFRGIGLKQHGTHATRFVHVDNYYGDALRPRPWIWTYT